VANSARSIETWLSTHHSPLVSTVGKHRRLSSADAQQSPVASIDIRRSSRPAETVSELPSTEPESSRDTPVPQADSEGEETDSANFESAHSQAHDSTFSSSVSSYLESPQPNSTEDNTTVNTSVATSEESTLRRSTRVSTKPDRYDPSKYSSRRQP